MSHRYQVTVQGKGFAAATDDGEGIVGFFAIRRVRADTQEEAYWTVVRALEREEKFQWLVESTRKHTAEQPRYKLELEDIGYLPWWRWHFTPALHNYVFYSGAEDDVHVKA